MRTVKHKLIIQKEKDVPSTELSKLMEVMYAYQFEKNYFSDQLLNRSHEAEASASLINLQSSYIQIRDKLVQNGYQSKYNLPARLWKMALKEAYDLHIRTHESQVALIKRNLNNNLYQYCHCELIKQIKDNLKDLKNKNELAVIHVIQCFEKFLYFATNSLFFNYKTFCQFEAKYFSKKFSKARVYQRAKTLLMDLLKPSNAVKKEVLTKEEAKQLKQLLESGSDQFSLCNQLFQHYCHGLVKAIQKFRGFKQIQSQINPTITLDGDCYDLYSVYDNEAKKNNWFLNIMSLESGKRIKGLELTGFHHAKQIMKHKKSANLTLSFDPNNLADGVAVHFTFDTHPIRKPKLVTKKKLRQKVKKCNNNSHCHHTHTVTVVGGDFGLTESFTFSDGWVAGRTQKKILKDIADSTKDDVAKIQSNSQKKYFGLEKNNPTNKRNHINNCFNHNSEKNNINTNYRKRQQRYNSWLENYKHQMVNDIIDHFTTDNEYGQYASCVSHTSYANYGGSNTDKSLTKLTLVFEDLNYINLGRTKDDKRQINLIKGVLTLLEEKIKLYNLPIEIKYVNPAYTSQSCPSCYYVDRKNRNSRQDDFRCLHCGFTANEDVRYRELTGVVQRGEAITLPSKDDFIAACNIAERLSVLPNSTKLHQRKIKDLLMEKHEQVKGSCKMFT